MGRPRKPYFRSSDGWWVSRFNGRYERLAKGKDNKQEAYRRFHELSLSDSSNQPSNPNIHTISTLIRLYIQLNQDKYASRAFETRRHYWDAFVDEFGERQVTDHDCPPILLEQWITDHPEWESNWTKGHVVGIIQRPFNWAVKKRLIPSNPFRGVEKVTGEPWRPMTDVEFQKLLRVTSNGQRRFTPTNKKKKQYPSDRRRRQRPSAGARFRQVLMFLRFTGARPGEMCNLEWSDIDLENQVIILRQHKTSKKTKKPRVIPIHPVILKLFVYLRNLNQPGNHVFLTYRKTPWHRSTLSTRMQRARLVAGVSGDAKLYGLRHRFGTKAVLNGVDLKTLAELMGHTSTRMTEHYLHVAGQRSHLAEAMKRVNDTE